MGMPIRLLTLTTSMAQSMLFQMLPVESPQPLVFHKFPFLCKISSAAAPTMRGLAPLLRPPMGSYQGGCPTIAHQEFKPPMQPSMQQEVILPNPKNYKIPANLWDLDIPRAAREPGPLAQNFHPSLRYYGESILSDTQQRWCIPTSR